MRISDWSSDVCSSDLAGEVVDRRQTDIADDVAGELPVGVEPARHHLDLDPRQLRRVDRNPGYILPAERSEEHTSELQSLMRNSYAVFCLKKKITQNK